MRLDCNDKIEHGNHKIHQQRVFFDGNDYTPQSLGAWRLERMRTIAVESVPKIWTK